MTVLVPPSAPTELLNQRGFYRFVRASPTLSAAACEAEVIITDEWLLQQLPPLHEFPRLRLVQALTSGIETIRPHVPPTVTLCNVGPGVHDRSVAEWVVMVIISSLRSRPEPEPLAGKRVLVIGYGATGRALEARLAGFEVTLKRVAAHPRPGVSSPREIKSLLPGSNIVVLLAPLTNHTRSLVDKDFLAALSDGTLLVNASRGGLVDQDALLAALLDERLYAALDVTTPEPLPRDHPLRQAPNCILTPHVAGTTRGWETRAYAAAAKQLDRYRQGEPLENVRAEY